MSKYNLVNLQVLTEAVIWIAVIVAIRIWGKETVSKTSLGLQYSQQNQTFEYRYFAAFAMLRTIGDLFYLCVQYLSAKMPISANTIDLSYNLVYWITFLLQAILIFLLMGALIRSCLRPLPGLSSAAIIVFRWAALLAAVLAVTAHIPSLRVATWHRSLADTCFSFQFCVCSFEITLLWLLLVNMRRLGLFVRSRVVGFALGLAAFGLSDYLVGFIASVTPSMIDSANFIGESVTILTAAIWLYYIVMPEPKRQPHSLSPASSLMKWNEVALKLGMGGRQSEQVPFISGVESKVDAVLDRFKARVG